MEWDGHPELKLQADPRIWHQTQGVNERISVAAIYEHLGEPPEDPIQRQMMYHRGIRLTQSHIRDDAALLAIEDMLEPDAERAFPFWHERAGQYGSPLLFITEECPNLWRELTALRRPPMERDGMYGEGIKNGQADHAFDALKRIAGPLRSVTLTNGRGRRGMPALQIAYAS